MRGPVYERVVMLRRMMMQVMSPGMQIEVGSGMGMQMGMMSPSTQSSDAASPTALTPSVSLMQYPICFSMHIAVCSSMRREHQH